MKKSIFSLGAATLLAVAMPALAQNALPVSQTGSVVVTLRTGKSNLVGLPFTRQIVNKARITAAVSGSVLTSTDAGFPTLVGAAGPHSVQILTGTARGQVAAITAATADSVTLATAIAGLNVGDEFIVYQDWTFASAFGDGTANNPLKVDAGTSLNDADTVIVESAGNTQTYIFSEDENFWVRLLPTPTSTTQNNVRIPLVNGVIIKRQAALPDVPMIVSGHLRSGGRQVHLLETGTNIVSNVNSLDGSSRSTLGSLLGTTSGNVQLQAGTSLNDADNVILQNATNGNLETYIFSSDEGFWVRLLPTPSSTTQNARVLPAGSALRIKRVGAAKNLNLEPVFAP